MGWGRGWRQGHGLSGIASLGSRDHGALKGRRLESPAFLSRQCSRYTQLRNLFWSCLGHPCRCSPWCAAHPTNDTRQGILELCFRFCWRCVVRLVTQLPASVWSISIYLHVVENNPAHYACWLSAALSGDAFTARACSVVACIARLRPRFLASYSAASAAAISVSSCRRALVSSLSTAT